MGFRSDGAFEQNFALDSPLRVLVMIVFASVMIITLFTMYFVMIARKIANKKFEGMMIMLLMISLAQHIMLFVFLFADTPPILDWILTTFGIYIIMGSAILNCEILYFFSSLTEYWTLRRIRIFQGFWVLFHFFCYLEGYTQLALLGRSIPASIHRGIFLYGNGVTLFSIAVSLTYTVKCLYIIRLITKHFGVGKQDAGHKRVYLTKRLIFTIAIGTIFDWVGIVLFAIGIGMVDFRPFFNLGVSCMHLHVNSIAVIFYQLKYITIAKDEDADGPPKKTIQWLVRPGKEKGQELMASQRTVTQIQTRVISD
jgi:hypothetical protein